MNELALLLLPLLVFLHYQVLRLKRMGRQDKAQFELIDLDIEITRLLSRTWDRMTLDDYLLVKKVCETVDQRQMALKG